MKPTLEIDNRRDSIALTLPTSRVFPKANSNYQEAALFCVLLTAVTLPLLNAADAVAELIRSSGGAF